MITRTLSRRRLLGGSVAMTGSLLTGCSFGQSKPHVDGELVAWPLEDRWPTKFHEAPQQVQEAYRYAAFRPDVLLYVPCFCGCVAQGHTSVQDCYVAEFRSDGSVLLDPMSFGWGVCIGVTRDVMRLSSQGMSPSEIRAYIDTHWSGAGPGTDTPLPPTT